MCVKHEKYAHNNKESVNYQSYVIEKKREHKCHFYPSHTRIPKIQTPTCTLYTYEKFNNRCTASKISQLEVIRI